MKKIFSLLMALMVVLSISARVPASLEMMHSKKQAAKAELRHHRSAPRKMVRTAAMPKAAPRMMAAATSAFDAVQVEYYMSYSTEDAIDHYITFYNIATDYPMAALDIYTSAVGAIEGTYSVAAGNLDLEYAGYYTDDEDEGAEITAASLTISKSGELYTFEGSLTAGGAEYPISITAAVEVMDGDYPYEPAQQSDIVLNFDTMEIDTEWLADYGEMDYYFYTAEENVLALAYFPTNTSIKSVPDGTYSFSDTDYDAFGTGYYYYGFPGGSYYATDEAYFYIVSGSVTVATEDNVTTITMNAVSAYGTKISFSYSYSKGTTPTPKPGEGIEIVIKDYATTSFTAGNITISTAKNKGNEPAYNDRSFDLRVYQQNTLTIASTGSMQQIVFYISEKGLEQQGEITPSTGSMTYDMANGLVYWTGNATSVTFTVGANTYGTNTAKSGGQFDFTKIVITGEGGDTPTPPTPSGDVTITGLVYADAVFNADAEYGDYWEFDFYNDLDEEGYILPPYVYFVCNESTTSGTKIAGTWTVWAGGYYPTTDEESGVFTPESNAVGSLTVTCVSQGVYSFVGSFVGEDGKTYKWTLNNVEVYAYDYESYEEITLTDGGTPTPPTPVGDEITVAEAEAIAGALKDNEITTTIYTIIGYVGTLYDGGDFYLVSEKGGRSDLQVYKPTVDKTLTKGDYVKVVGKLQKYISKAGKTTLEVVNATVTHIQGTALAEIMQNAKVKKMLKQGKVVILRGDKVFDLSGMQIKE